MVTSFFSLIELLLLLCAGLLGGPPLLGVPPLPEDPALLRSAPADTEIYLGWFGAAEPRTTSANATERFAAEPQLRELGRKAWRAAYAAAVREIDTPLTQPGLDLLAGALRRPGCLWVAGIGDTATLRCGIVLSVGKDIALVESFFGQLTKVVQAANRGDAATVDPPAIDGVALHALPVERGAPPVAFGIVDGYAVVAVGAGAAATIVGGLRGAPGFSEHPVLARVHAKAQVAQPALRTFVDLGKLLALLRQELSERERAPFDALGLDSVQAWVSETGLEGTASVSRSMLVLDAQRGRLLQLLAGKPLQGDELAIVPPDATVAAALRLDAALVYRALRDVIAAGGEHDLAELDRAVAEIEDATGLSLERDVLATLGDSIALWSAPSQGGALGLGLTAAVSLRDGKAFRAHFAKIMAAVERVLPRKPKTEQRVPRGVYLGQTWAQDTPIWFVNTVGDDVPIAPAWCVTDTHVMVSLFPQMLVAAIERGAAATPALAMRPELAGEPSVGIGFADVGEIVRSTYPGLLMLGQVLLAEAQRDGFALEVSDLPPASVLLRHLRPEVVRLRIDQQGYVLTREGVLPFFDPGVAVAMPIFTGAMFLRMQMARLHAVDRRAVEAEALQRARAEAERRAAEEAQKK